MEALEAALVKKNYIEEHVRDIIRRNESMDNIEPVGLTPAETEIVRLISRGMTTKEIASKKFLSVHTIITHRKNIFRKLNIRNISELMMYAMKSGIIDTTEYYI